MEMMKLTELIPERIGPAVETMISYYLHDII